MNDFVASSNRRSISCFSIYKICERDYFTKAKDLKLILYDNFAHGPIGRTNT